MFQIKNKETNEVRWVYEIQHLEDGTVRFLTYDYKQNVWQYVPWFEWVPAIFPWYVNNCNHCV